MRKYEEIEEEHVETYQTRSDEKFTSHGDNEKA
jgi:hypothetical protein